MSSEEPRIRRIEERLSNVESELKYNVVKKDGPLMNELRRLSVQVATKQEIDKALQSQTKDLKKTAFNKFSRKEKLLALATGVALVVLNVWQILQHSTHHH